MEALLLSLHWHVAYPLKIASQDDSEAKLARHLPWDSPWVSEQSKMTGKRRTAPPLLGGQRTVLAARRTRAVSLGSRTACL